MCRVMACRFCGAACEQLPCARHQLLIACFADIDPHDGHIKQPACTPFTQASLTAAVRNINAHNKSVAVELRGYLLEELRDATNFKALQADVADANIFIGSLIFIEELADKVG